MKLLRLEIHDEFRSLHKGFSIDFHKDMDSMDTFQPFCFAGLNGSGKSNVLEALASIFYHLEFCVAKYKPDSFEKHFKRHVSTPNAYSLEYLIDENIDTYNLKSAYKVTITKQCNHKIEEENEPKLTIQKYENPFGALGEKLKVSMRTMNNEEAAAAKIYLPDLVVGYSSGENETLSLPFIKTRLVNFDKYCEDFMKGIIFAEQESSLIYIDEEMSQAVLLSVLLFEDQKTLKPLINELGILAIDSFTINLNNHFHRIKDYQKDVLILDHINEKLDQLKKASTSWFEDKDDVNNDDDGPYSTISLDFHVNRATKSAFRKFFNTPFELFRFFQVLYELNAVYTSEDIKEEVYSSKGFYTKNKLPRHAPNDTVFHFLDYKIIKKIKGKKEPKALLLREFSDGEQQFLHTIGISLMLKDRRTLLLLDEPETHFNPAWRAKFIKILNDSITAGSLSDLTDEDFNIHLLKDIILTSHSPFIISDCMPKNVIFFDRNKETELVEARSAKELDLKTFGMSVETILDELFDYNQSIGDWSNEQLLKIDFANVKTDADKKAIKKQLRILGPSIEKDLVLAKLNRIKTEE